MDSGMAAEARVIDAQRKGLVMSHSHRWWTLDPTLWPGLDPAPPEFHSCPCYFCIICFRFKVRAFNNQLAPFQTHCQQSSCQSKDLSGIDPELGQSRCDDCPPHSYQPICGELSLPRVSLSKPCRVNIFVLQPWPLESERVNSQTHFTQFLMSASPLATCISAQDALA